MPGKKTPDVPSTGANSDSESYLEHTIIALQKTFSRVSYMSAGVAEGDARALITGPVKFEVRLNVDLEDDHLALAHSGGIELFLSGTITPDVQEVASEETDHER